MMTVRYGLFVEQVVSRRKKLRLLQHLLMNLSYILKTIRFLESVIVITLTHNNADMLG